MIIRFAKTGEVVALDYREMAPAAATPDMFAKPAARGNGASPPSSCFGFVAAAVPGVVAGHAEALRRFGTKPLSRLTAPAVRLAEEGFAVYNFLHRNLLADAAGLARWPSTAAIYLPDGDVPGLGERLVQRDAGQLLRLLVEEEQAAAGRARAGAIRAARETS